MAAADLPTSTHKMAVKAVDSHQSSGNQPMKAEVTSNDFEPKSSGMKNMDVPKKRTTFKILGVTKSAPRSGSNDPLNDDGDSLDDLDESHTEEISSDILDSSKNTDGDQDTPSEDTTHNLTPDEIVVKEKTTDFHSRFKVVKIETKEPFRRGRWICYDFLDTPANNNADRNEIRFLVDSASGNSSTTSSVNFIFGVDDPSKNPFLTHLLPSIEASGGAAPPVSVVTVVPSLPSCGIHLPTNSETFKPIQPPSQSNQNSGQNMRTDGGGVVSVAGGSGIPTMVPLGAKIAGTTIHTNPISLPTSNALQAQSHMSQGHQSTPMSSSKTPVNPTANLVVNPTVATSNSPANSGTTVSSVHQGAQQSPSNPALRESSNLTAPQPSKVLPSPVTRANTAQSVAPIIHVSNPTNPSDAHGSASSIASISSVPMTVQSTQQMHMSGAAGGSQATATHSQCPLAVSSHMPPGAVTPGMSHQSLDSKLEKSGSGLVHDVVGKASGEHVNVRPENIQLNEVLDNDRLFDASMQAAASLSLTPLTSAVSEMGTPAKEGKEDR